MGSAASLDIVTTRIRAELGVERAAGNPLKAAYHAVARRLGLSPRRVRAYHHGEVQADSVTAAELIAADAAWRREIETIRARLAALEGRDGQIAADPRRHVATAGVDQPGAAMRVPGGSMAAPADPLARVVMGSDRP